MKLHFTLEEKVDWLDRKGFVTGKKEVSFNTYNPYSNKKTGSFVKEVPLFKDIQLVDSFREYLKRIEELFHREFKKHLLSL